jgi:hypothetical protein
MGAVMEERETWCDGSKKEKRRKKRREGRREIERVVQLTD